MITNRMSVAADAAAERYGLLMDGWRAVYRDAIDDRRFGSARLLREVRTRAYDQARTFMEIEIEFVESEITNMTDEAKAAIEDQRRTAVDSGVAKNEVVEANFALLQREMTIQMERDVAFMIASLRRSYLNVALAARARGISHKAALIQYRIGNATELQFFFHDRSSRKWPSRRFIRSVWRQTLLSAYNESALVALAALGEDKAQIEHASPAAATNGLVISMSPDSTLPIYSEVRDEVFHPNAEAILRGVD